MPTLVELSDTRALSITFTTDQHAALVRLSKERRRAIAFIVRAAVDEFLAKSTEAQSTEPERATA